MKKRRTIFLLCGVSTIEAFSKASFKGLERVGKGRDSNQKGLLSNSIGYGEAPLFECGVHLKASGVDLELPPLQKAGQSICNAAISLGSSWADAADQFGHAADALSEAVVTEKTSSIADFSSALEEAAFQLRDASEVEGCLSIGPIAVIPNLIEFAESLMKADESVSTSQVNHPRNLLAAARACLSYVQWLEAGGERNTEVKSP